MFRSILEFGLQCCGAVHEVSVSSTTIVYSHGQFLVAQFRGDDEALHLDQHVRCAVLVIAIFVVMCVGAWFMHVAVLWALTPG